MKKNENARSTKIQKWSPTNIDWEETTGEVEENASEISSIPDIVSDWKSSDLSALTVKDLDDKTYRVPQTLPRTNLGKTTKTKYHLRNVEMVIKEENRFRKDKELSSNNNEETILPWRNGEYGSV